MGMKRKILRSPSVNYLIRDDFTGDLAAGSVNGTPAVPGPGTRGVTDAANKLSLASGNLVMTSNGAIWDPFSNYGTLTRTAGRMILYPHITRTTPEKIMLGASADGGVALSSALMLDPAGYLGVWDNVNWTDIVTVEVGGTTYSFAIVLRAAGAFFFVKGGLYTNWELLYMTMIDTTTPIYPGFWNSESVLTASAIRIPRRLWLPAPLSSDGMSATTLTDGLGHPESTGLGAGGAGLVYMPGTWSVAGGVAANTPTLGAESVVNGNMETGDPPTDWWPNDATVDGVADERTGGGGAQSISIIATAGDGRAAHITTLPIGFFRLTAWGKMMAGSGTGYMYCGNMGYVFWAAGVWTQKTCVMLTTAVNPWMNLIAGAAAPDHMRYDDVSVKPLTLSELVRVPLTPVAPDVIAQVQVKALTTYCQAGLALRLNDPIAPSAGILVFYDGYGDLVGYEFSGATWTQLFSAAHAFAANDHIQVVMEGASIRAYILTSAGVGTIIATTAAATITTGGYHGIFSTDSGNQLDKLVVYPRGSNGEYSLLSKWAS
jgi:hypothetical protein